MSFEECYEQGINAELRFADQLQDPIFANDYQNMFEHWDVQSQGVRYDVKAMKRWKRSDKEATDRMHFVELRNVRGELGWLYGEAEYIVFETRSYWMLVNRQKLVWLIEEKTQNNERSSKPDVYKLYQRKDRKDLITVVPTVDLLAISEQAIRKNQK